MPRVCGPNAGHASQGRPHPHGDDGLQAHDASHGPPPPVPGRDATDAPDDDAM